jgi:hypothetical protein
MKKYWILIILLFSGLFLNAQLVIVDCGNPVLKDYYKSHKDMFASREIQVVDTIELPFFDDFAASNLFTDTTKWLDKFAFVNNDYAIDPISINVASLDAINQYGEVYSHLPSLSSSIADYLTSVPINLAVNASDSVYLSFYYQAGGSGNSPEERDSLVLEFKAPDTDWKGIWNVGGSADMDSFNIVMIPITDEIYLVKGFQFRFLNYASLSSSYEPSWVSNTDVWNIDYIKLDTARSLSDTLSEDVAFIKNFGSKLMGYESVPWNHFKDYIGDIVNDSLTFVYKSTYGINDTININRQVQIVDIYGSEPTYSMLDDSENILPLETIEYTRPIIYDFNSDSEDSARFLIKGYLKTDFTADRYIYRWNDTIEYYQEFKNYYAYDDGTAEKGFGISGQGTAFSSICTQFAPLKADTLKGVYIYFNQVLNEANRKYFFLTIWSDDDGIPGDTIFQKIGVKPIYNDNINGYLYYPLDTTIYIDTTFYIGWVKTTDDMLNCGYDLNNDAGSYVFYNVGGEWIQSAYSGSMMIRPAFGYAYDNPAIIPVITKRDFDIYPNPAADYIRIKTEEVFTSVALYDATGRLIRRFNRTEEIYVGDIEQGTYFIRPESDFVMYNTKKILVIR